MSKDDRKQENCCAVSCGKKAKYEIGDKGKPYENAFVCEEHKDIFVCDWRVSYE